MRYVMASRRSGKFRETEKRAARAAMDTTVTAMAADMKIVDELAPEDTELRRVTVFDAEADFLERNAANIPDDVIVEPEILHFHDVVETLDIQNAPQSADLQFNAGAGSNSFTVTVLGSGSAGPLEGAEVTLHLRAFGNQRSKVEGKTAADGTLTLTYLPWFEPIGMFVQPAGDFWNVLVRGPSSPETVRCKRLPLNRRLGWWHEATGITRHQPNRGSGIKVGVVDSGVGPNRNLAHVTDIGSFRDGAANPGDGADSGSHGSHVSGTIGARPGGAQTRGYAGIAPGADLYSARVFPKKGGASQGDIASAIDALSKTHKVDLINMSLGARAPSRIIHDAIRDAFERGTLCICAAGNDNTSVRWPAAFPETVAVSALGQLGWGPPDSLSGTRVPSDADRFADHQMYLANFSCFGPEVECCAPGVGIVATVPEQSELYAPYANMDGTSMACPVATGIAAALLQDDNAYQALARNTVRAQHARLVLLRSCDDIGLKSTFQGRGITTD